MQLSIVKEYKNLLFNLSKVIDISGYRNDYIAQKIGMKAPNFAVKKKRATWTVDEVEKILITVENEDVRNFLEIQKIKNSETGKALSSEDFEKQMGW